MLGAYGISVARIATIFLAMAVYGQEVWNAHMDIWELNKLS